MALLAMVSDEVAMLVSVDKYPAVARPATVDRSALDSVALLTYPAVPNPVMVERNSVKSTKDEIKDDIPATVDVS